MSLAMRAAAVTLACLVAATHGRRVAFTPSGVTGAWPGDHFAVNHAIGKRAMPPSMFLGTGKPAWKEAQEAKEKEGASKQTTYSGGGGLSASPAWKLAQEAKEKEGVPKSSSYSGGGFSKAEPTWKDPAKLKAREELPQGGLVRLNTPKTWEPAWKKAKVTVRKYGDEVDEAAPSEAPTSETNPAAESSTKQDFLEFEPYTDRSNMPDNTFKPKSPFEGKIVSVERIVGPKATGETCDIIIDHGGKMPYIEGQSYGVIPPGVSPKTGKPNKVRLYSIASSRYGDDMTGTTTTLCVRRATYWDPEMGKEDPAKKGVCSNYLCDAKCGDVVKLTGPSGKVMLLPEDKPETDIIMVATGTGIAPYRSFLRRMFVEKTPYATDFKGLAWLFLGVANSDALLYDDAWKAIQKENPDQFRYDVALSREQTNKDGGKMYIQDRVEEYSDEIFDRLDKGAHIYFCGLKGMMPGIENMLEKVATAKELDYKEFIKKLKKNGQWHVEVY